MSVLKKFVIYEISPDGLVREPEFNEGYGYSGSFYGTFDTEDEAVSAIKSKKKPYRDFVVLPVYTYKD